MTNHLPTVTPPSELVRKWLNDFRSPCGAMELGPGEVALHITARAAQWGADQELEACLDWFNSNDADLQARLLYAHRRPKPPSLKEMALEDLNTLLADLKCHGLGANTDTIRNALEALND